jgi:uncharacterized protein
MQPHITAIPILHLASGDPVALQLYSFKGDSPGAKVYIQANLHGAEIIGNAVIHRLLDWLGSLEPQQLRGEIWLVPLCNPLGANQRTHYFSTGRFNPYDGKDWNRIFWDYTQSGEDMLDFAQSCLNLDIDTIQQRYRKRIHHCFLALGDRLLAPTGGALREHYRFHLQSLCWDADYLIDLHSTSNQGLDYLYYFHHREDSAQLFGLNYGILLDHYDGDAFDEAFIKPWLALERCFVQLGRDLQFDIEAWTLELGAGMQIKPTSVERGVVGIQNYLMAKGIVQCLPISPTSQQPQMYFTKTSQIQKYYAPYGGLIFFDVALGTVVNPGQVLYHLLSFNKQSQPPVTLDICAVQQGIVYDIAANQAVSTGDYVLGIF